MRLFLVALALLPATLTVVGPVAHAAPPTPRIKMVTPTPTPIAKNAPVIVTALQSAPDGLIVLSRAAAGGRKDLWLFPDDNGPTTQLTNTPDADETWPAWNPSKKLIAFERGGEIWTIRWDGKDEKQITPESGTPRGDEQPRWSPDGTKIIFASGRTGNYDLYTVPAEGGPLTNLTSSAANETSGSFSPDGSRIAYASDVRGFWDVYIASADGTGASRVRTAEFADTDPIWGKGDILAFFHVALHTDVNHRGLWLMRIDGSGLEKVSDGQGSVDFSRDGQRIVYGLSRNGGQEIHYQNLGGTGGRFVGGCGAGEFFGTPNW